MGYDFDAIIIGAGHNSLTAAGYLGRADLRTLVLERRHDLDQIFSLRPHPSAAKYRTPLKGLYLCGSGAHPGRAVTGAPGHNSAKRVIRDLR